jgi:hypothetical protein
LTENKNKKAELLGLAHLADQNCHKNEKIYYSDIGLGPEIGLVGLG